MEHFREIFTTNLQDHFEANPTIYTVWEGGSAATGFLDEWSDIDLYVICEDDAVETVFEQLEAYLDKQYTLQTKYRLAEPTWHGHSQCFYKLEKTPPLFYIDLLVMKRSADNYFSESDRHGQGKLWFDKADLYDTTPTPEEDVLRKGKATYQMLKNTIEFVLMDIRKHVIRCNNIDALDIYNRGLLERLAYLLNLKYRPAKFDFGLRYANREYPRDIVALLEEFMFVQDMNHLQRNVERIEPLFYEVLEELKERWDEKW